MLSYLFGAAAAAAGEAAPASPERVDLRPSEDLTPEKLLEVERWESSSESEAE